jgi:predicted Zn-dependent protease
MNKTATNLLYHSITRLLPLVLLFGFSVSLRSSELPALGDGSSVITPSQEKALGQSWVRQLRGQVPMINDPVIAEYLEDLMYRLMPNSDLTDSDLTITVIDSPELNAFAVPGGIIGVNAGMFLYSDNEQELASVLAHELAHLSQRHFARRLEESGKQMALNMAGILASVILAATAGSDAGIAALASSQALTLQQQLSYSRLNEQEADRMGIQTLAASGMNAQAMVNMFERMMRSQRFNRSMPVYLRTHPLTESRIADMASRSQTYPTTPYTENQDFYFVQSRVQVYYSSNLEEMITRFRAAQQHTRSNVRVGALYGEVLALIQSNRAAEAEKSLTTLLQQEPTSIMINLLKAEWLLALQRIEDALQLLESNLTLNPANYSLTRAYAGALTDKQEFTKAYSELKHLSISYPNDIGLWYELAEVAGLANNIVELHRARAEYFFLKADMLSAKKQLEQALSKSEGNYQQSVLIRNRLREMEGTGEFFTF